MSGCRRRKGTLEDEVLAYLDAAAHPRTVAEVQAGLVGQLAYNTVLTVLVRLHAKGLVDRERAGRAYAYSLPAEPASRPTAVIARRMVRLLYAQDEPAGVLARFVGGLSADDRQLLAVLAGGRQPSGTAIMRP